MKNGATLGLAFLLISVGAVAGEGDSLKQKPIRYFFTLNSSVMFCGSCTTESSTVALPTTIHGIQWKGLRVGGGLGYTSFGPIRTMPMFGSLTLNLYGPKQKRGLFVEANVGGAHAWLAKSVREGGFLKDVDAWGFTQLSAGYAFNYYKLRLAAQAGIHTMKTIRKYQYGEPYLYPWGTMDLVVLPRQEFIEYETTRLFIAISIGI